MNRKKSKKIKTLAIGIFVGFLVGLVIGIVGLCLWIA